MAAEWEKSAVSELDVTATDLSADCLIDLLTRIPALRWLSAGQLDGFTDAVRREIFFFIYGDCGGIFIFLVMCGFRLTVFFFCFLFFYSRVGFKICFRLATYFFY